MNEKILGIVSLIVAMLLVGVLAVGDSPVTAAPQDVENQIARVVVSDVISILVPSVVENTWLTVYPADGLELLIGGVAGASNNVTSRSRGRIDVFIRSNHGPNIPHTTVLGENLTDFQFTNDTGNIRPFGTVYERMIANWLIPRGTPLDSPLTRRTIPLRVDVPSYAVNGTYEATVTYAAVRHGHPAPA